MWSSAGSANQLSDCELEVSLCHTRVRHVPRAISYITSQDVDVSHRKMETFSSYHRRRSDRCINLLAHRRWFVLPQLRGNRSMHHDAKRGSRWKGGGSTTQLMIIKRAPCPLRINAARAMCPISLAPGSTRSDPALEGYRVEKGKGILGVFRKSGGRCFCSYRDASASKRPREFSCSGARSEEWLARRHGKLSVFLLSTF